jgi:hypothetical protein
MQRTTLQRLVVAAFAALMTSAALAQGITHAPPRPRHEIVPPPRAGFVWDPGHWRWVRGRYVWVGGRWTPARPGHRWVPGHWARTGRAWHWVPGGWV